MFRSATATLFLCAACATAPTAVPLPAPLPPVTVQVTRALVEQPTPTALTLPTRTSAPPTLSARVTAPPVVVPSPVQVTAIPTRAAVLSTAPPPSATPPATAAPLAEVTAAPTVPLPSATPFPVAVFPTRSTPAAIIDSRNWSFGVTPGEVDEGGEVNVTWHAPGASQLQIFVAYGDGWRTSETVLPKSGDYHPSSGSARYNVPVGHKVILVTFIEQNLPDFVEVRREVFVRCSPQGLNNGACKAEEARLRASGFFSVTPSPDSAGSSAAPTAVPERNVAAAYQPFEHGFMLWLSGEPSTVWVLFDDGRSKSYVDGWQGREAPYAGNPAPAGLVVPMRGFGAIWKANAEVRDALGYAREPERGYTARVSASQKSIYFGDTPFVTLPDGSVLKTFGPYNGGWFVDR